MVVQVATHLRFVFRHQNLFHNCVCIPVSADRTSLRDIVPVRASVISLTPKDESLPFGVALRELLRKALGSAVYDLIKCSPTSDFNHRLDDVSLRLGPTRKFLHHVHERGAMGDPRLDVYPPDFHEVNDVGEVFRARVPAG